MLLRFDTCIASHTPKNACSNVRRPQLLHRQLTKCTGSRRDSVGSTASSAAEELLAAIANTNRGTSTDSMSRQRVLRAVEQLERASTRVTNEAVCATWRLLWTTEKETLFILKNARLFGTEAGEVYQVVDTAAGKLQNIITFPPDGAFMVDSDIQVESEKRINFQFTGATLKLTTRKLNLPPFGKGWFESTYVDDSIRVARDSRGDVLVVARDGAPRVFG